MNIAQVSKIGVTSPIEESCDVGKEHLGCGSTRPFRSYNEQLKTL